MPLDTDRALLTLAPPRLATTALALLDAEDFAVARDAIIDFENWATFDDYLCEREGFAIGLASAGVRAPLVPVSLRDFEGWRRRARMPPTVTSLDVFATLAGALRDGKFPRFARRATDDDDGPVWARPADDPNSIAAGFLALYADWLDCIGAVPICPVPPSAEAYAQRLAEALAETS